MWLQNNTDSLPNQILMTNLLVIDKRKAEWNKLKDKYPDRIPIICEKSPKSSLESLAKEKWVFFKIWPKLIFELWNYNFFSEELL